MHAQETCLADFPPFSCGAEERGKRGEKTRPARGNKKTAQRRNAAPREFSKRAKLALPDQISTPSRFFTRIPITKERAATPMLMQAISRKRFLNFMPFATEM